MFCASPNSAQDNHQSPFNAPQKKNNQFRKDIRRHQIEQKLKVMREEILESLSEDYHVLKNINLNKAFQMFMSVDEADIAGSWKQLEQSSSDIFIYSRSDQSDHLYFLFDERVIFKLVSLLEIQKMPLFSRNPRTYIRILWVLANYVSYSSESIEHFAPILISLFREITSLKDFYSSKNQYKIFTHSQARQIVEIVLFAINNQAMNSQYLLSICLNQSPQKCFIYTLMTQFELLMNFTQGNHIKDTLIPSILSKLLCIFEHTLKFEVEDGMTMDKMYALDFKIVNILLQMLAVLAKQQKQPFIQYQITVIMRQFLFTHLFVKPQIITSHNFTILFEMANSTVQRLSANSYQVSNYSNMLDIEGEVKPSIGVFRQRIGQLEKKMAQLLEILIILFGLNLPEDNNEQYYDTYETWIKRYLVKVICKLFKPSLDNFDQLRHKSLEIIRNVCLQQQFCDLILNQPPILNKVFYYIHSEAIGVRLKKSALSVLNSIICITLEGNSDLKMDTIQMLRNNKICEIFAKYIGEYVDEELNKNLLQSLLLFLETETAEDPQDHLLWRKYCQQGGMVKLQKYHSDTQNRKIQQLIGIILQTYKH